MTKDFCRSTGKFASPWIP